MKTVSYVFVILFFVGAPPAFGYIDPGSGSALLSIIIGFIVAVGIVLKTFWYKITGYLGLSKRKTNSVPKSDKKGPTE